MSKKIHFAKEACSKIEHNDDGRIYEFIKQIKMFSEINEISKIIEILKDFCEKLNDNINFSFECIEKSDIIYIFNLLETNNDTLSSYVLEVISLLLKDNVLFGSLLLSYKDPAPILIHIVELKPGLFNNTIVVLKNMLIHEETRSYLYQAMMPQYLYDKLPKYNNGDHLERYVTILKWICSCAKYSTLDENESIMATVYKPFFLEHKSYHETYYKKYYIKILYFLYEQDSCKQLLNDDFFKHLCAVLQDYRMYDSFSYIYRIFAKLAYNDDVPDVIIEQFPYRTVILKLGAEIEAIEKVYLLTMLSNLCFNHLFTDKLLVNKNDFFEILKNLYYRSNNDIKIEIINLVCVILQHSNSEAQHSIINSPIFWLILEIFESDKYELLNVIINILVPIISNLMKRNLMCQESIEFLYNKIDQSIFLHDDHSAEVLKKFRDNIFCN